MPDATARSIANAIDCGGAAPHQRRRLVSDEMVPGLVGFVDAAVVVAVGFVIYGIRSGWGNVGQAASMEMHLAGSVLMAAVVAFVFHARGLYGFDVLSRWPQQSGSMWAGVVTVALLLTGLGFAFKIGDHFSRIWLICTTGASAILIWGLRGVVAALILRAAKAGGMSRTVALVGASGQAKRLVASLCEPKGPWMTIAGVFDDRETRIDAEVAGVPVLGTVDDLIAAVRRREIDVIVITLPWNAEARLAAIIDRLRELPVHIYVGADLISYRFGPPNRAFIPGISVLEVARAPFAGWSGFIKTIEDKALAILALLIFGPLMALIAAAIKLNSPGPVLFRQKRSGFNNEIIEVLKFRTMHHCRPDSGAFVQAKKNDPRITRVGRLLRRTSLDELPQILNVLSGSMSMVGPRPHPTKLNEQFEQLLARYHCRHKVKPGITGLAQINGWRGETDTLEKMRKRVEHDVHYIETWSLWLDIRILFATVFLGWVNKNAY